MSRFGPILQRALERLPRRDAIHLVGVELGLVLALTAGLALAAAPDGRSARLAKLTGGEISAQAFARLTSGMDPAMLSLANRLTPLQGGLTPAEIGRAHV